MIAYGVCIGSEDKFSSCARHGLAACAAASAPIAESRDNESIFSAYNQILDYFCASPELEAVVLLHEDLELRDGRFEAKIKSILSDGSVAIAGAVGAVDVTSLAWWEGSGRGRCAETRGLVDFGGGEHDVDSVDGLMMVLSAWAVRNLRFDELTYSGFHGYDADICFQARAAGRRVIVADFDLFHHTKGGYGDLESYRKADAAFRMKWIGPGSGRRPGCEDTSARSWAPSASRFVVGRAC